VVDEAHMVHGRLFPEAGELVLEASGPSLFESEGAGIGEHLGIEGDILFWRVHRVEPGSFRGLDVHAEAGDRGLQIRKLPRLRLHEGREEEGPEHGPEEAGGLERRRAGENGLHGREDRGDDAVCRQDDEGQNEEGKDQLHGEGQPVQGLCHVYLARCHEGQKGGKGEEGADKLEGVPGKARPCRA